jgi:enoyl-CoA hydratase
VSEVLLEVESGVALITLAAPERRNSFTAEMVAELLAACNAVDADASVGAAVVRAQGESFCAGAHRDLLARAAADPTEAGRYTQLGLAYQAFVRVGNLQVPSIAAVRGHAVGAGVNLMLATDLRIVAEGARIITGFARIGIHPGGGHFVLLARAGGREAASAMGVFGQEISGSRAFELGLAWEALPADAVEPRAQEIASTVAADPELARTTVRSFRLETGPPAASWPLGLEAERAAQMWSLRRSKLRP